MEECACRILEKEGDKVDYFEYGILDVDRKTVSERDEHPCSNSAHGNLSCFFWSDNLWADWPDDDLMEQYLRTDMEQRQIVDVLFGPECPFRDRSHQNRP